jgi:PAS domain S-box-containing protein
VTSGAPRGDAVSWRETLPVVLDDLGVTFVVEGDEGVVYANDAFRALAGYSPDDVLSGTRSRDFLQMSPRGEELAHYETELVHRDGRRIPVQVSERTVPLAGRRIVFSTFRDLSDRRRVEVELATRAHQQAVVAELGRRALAQPDISALMDTTVRLVATTLDVEFVKVLELLPGGEDLLLRAGFGWKPGCVGRATLRAGPDSHAGYTLASDSPVVVEDLPRETRFGVPPLLAEHDVVSALTVSIFGVGRAWGVLGADTSRHRRFSTDDVNFLQAIANVLAHAIRRTEAEAALREAHAQELALRRRLQAHSRLAMDAQEAERRRIARELHDEIGQALTGLKLTLENIRRAAPEGSAVQLGRATGLVDELLRRTQDLSLDLRPAMLDDLGLGPALWWLVERYTTQTGVEVTLGEEGLRGRLRPEVETAAYRIVQEALTNVARHSGVRRAKVSSTVVEDCLRVEVSDEGAGFEVAAVPTYGTSGLAGMEERARSTGGRFRVHSAPGRGTTVVAELALADPAGDES